MRWVSCRLLKLNIGKSEYLRELEMLGTWKRDKLKLRCLQEQWHKHTMMDKVEKYYE